MEYDIKEIASYAASFMVGRINYPMESIYDFSMKEFVINRFRFDVERKPELNNQLEDFRDAALKAGIDSSRIKLTSKHYNNRTSQYMEIELDTINIDIEYIEYRKFNEFSLIYNDWERRIRNLEDVDPLPLMKSIVVLGQKVLEFRKFWDSIETEIQKQAKLNLFMNSTWKSVIETKLNETELPYYFWGPDANSVRLTIALSNEYQCTYHIKYQSDVNEIDQYINDAIAASKMIATLPKSTKIQTIVQGCTWQNTKARI